MKIFFISVVFLAFSSISFGQFTTISPKIGFTLSKVRDFADFGYKPGYMFGVSTRYLLNSKFALKPELLIEQKGFQRTIQYTDENGWSKGQANIFATWNYLELPLQVQYSLFKRNRIFISAGGYAGYMVWASQRSVDELDGKSHNIRTKDDMNGYNRWDAGLSAGTGMRIPFKKINEIEVSFKYEYAFQIDKLHLPPSTHTFSVAVGYDLKIRK